MNGSDTARTLARLLRPLARSGAVLCYHGFRSSRSPDGSSLHVSVDEFRLAVDLARRLGHVVPTAELVRRHREGRSTRGLYAFTLDDAYLSLQEQAADFIRTAEVPVTVFAVPSALDGGRRFWWDRVDHLIPRLSTTEREALFDALGIPRPFRELHGRGFGPERPLRQWLLARYAARWPSHFEPLIAPLEHRTNAGLQDRSMTWEELTRFASIPTVDVGVHTLTHPALPLIPQADRYSEIAGSYRRLRERIPGTLPLLAAPFGLFDAGTLAAARDAGMVGTLTLTARTLRHPGPGDAVPRFCVLHGEPPVKLALRLAGGLDLYRALRGDAPPRYPVPPAVHVMDSEGTRGTGAKGRGQAALATRGAAELP